jgi:hypothetical protein
VRETYVEMAGARGKAILEALEQSVRAAEAQRDSARADGTQSATGSSE